MQPLSVTAAWPTGTQASRPPSPPASPQASPSSHGRASLSPGDSWLTPDHQRVTTAYAQPGNGGVPDLDGPASQEAGAATTPGEQVQRLLVLHVLGRSAQDRPRPLLGDRDLRQPSGRTAGRPGHAHMRAPFLVARLHPGRPAAAGRALSPPAHGPSTPRPSAPRRPASWSTLTITPAGSTSPTPAWPSDASAGAARCPGGSGGSGRRPHHGQRGNPGGGEVLLAAFGRGNRVGHRLGALARPPPGPRNPPTGPAPTGSPAPSWPPPTSSSRATSTKRSPTASA